MSEILLRRFAVVDQEFTRKLVQTINENEDVEIVRMFACIDHSAKYGFPMLLFQCLEIWIKEFNILYLQQILVGTP